MLKSRKLDGRKYRKQYSIGSYFAEFWCTSEKLIIELDEDLHDEYHKIQEDENRDNYRLNLKKSTTPAAMRLSIHLLSLCCGHPSFKRRGNFFSTSLLHTAVLDWRSVV